MITTQLLAIARGWVWEGDVRSFKIILEFFFFYSTLYYSNIIYKHEHNYALVD